MSSAPSPDIPNPPLPEPVQMNIVLDTNVLLSAFFTRGLCEAILDACITSESCTTCLSEFILDEFARHAAQTFGAPAADVASAVSLLRHHAMLVVPVPVDPAACPDADDLPVLGTAIAAHAAALVTGDLALQALGTIRQTPILSPRRFFNSLA